MIKIDLDKRNADKCNLDFYSNLRQEELVHKARCTSFKSIAKSAEKLAHYDKQIELLTSSLDQMENLLHDAMIAASFDGSEVYFAWNWNDDYGFAYGDIIREKYPTVFEAIAAYDRKKAGNGGYISGWLEIRGAGEIERINYLREQIATMQAELDKLEKGE
jgi:uncharacterized small protein (DUF1192 family)